MVEHKPSTLNIKGHSNQIVEMIDEEELNILRHKAHQRLGFGYLAMFRTMRYLFLVTIMLAVIMFFIGFLHWMEKPVATIGYSIFDELSIANANYSMPVCLQ